MERREQAKQERLQQLQIERDNNSPKPLFSAPVRVSLLPTKFYLIFDQFESIFRGPISKEI
jgi:hypothetical protein